jgi:diketogulonate reductase-like aldo/keto reductase
MQNKRLNSGTDIPEIGLGLFQIKDEAQCKAAVQAALDVGYRHFDTAQIYRNEQFLGDALQASNVGRNELFITTKIHIGNLGWDELIPSYDASLKRLRMDYVDLLLIHFPVTELRRPAGERMEELYKAGRTKAIGVSNYTIAHLEELLRECSVKPAVNQVELHVYLQQPELIDYCLSRGIVVEAYSPLAQGHGLDNSALAAIGAKYGKTPAQIMIRWCLDQGTVPLPKSAHQNRIVENFNVFDFSLDAEDLAELKKLNRNYRTAWDPTHVA